IGKMPLYPSTDQLITNNYPPLSFYIVGLVGRFIGDPMLAGRLLSLVAVVAIATAIALSVRRLGGSGVAGKISAAFFVATMSRFFFQHLNSKALFVEKGRSHFWRIRMGVCRFSHLPLQCLGSSA